MEPKWIDPFSNKSFRGGGDMIVVSSGTETPSGELGTAWACSTMPVLTALASRPGDLRSGEDELCAASDPPVTRTARTRSMPRVCDIGPGLA